MHQARPTPLPVQAFEQGLVEMKTGRGRGNGTRHLAVNGLVAIAIHALVGTLDIRRQRHMPSLIQQFGPVRTIANGQVPELPFPLSHLQACDVVNLQFAALNRLAIGTKLHQCPAWLDQSFDQDFDRPATGLAAEQACRNDPGIVEDQQILVSQQVWQVSKLPIDSLVRGPINVQQSGRRTLG